MIYFARSYIPDFDGKIQKYISALDASNIEHHFVGWSRQGEIKAERENQTFYRRRAPIGGGIKNLLGMVYWNLFLFNLLRKNRKKISIVHAIDFDSAFAGFLFCKIYSKKIVFDIYDKYTDTRNVPQILKKVIDKFEYLLIKYSDLVILADNNRYVQQGVKESQRNIIVMENVPRDMSFSFKSENKNPECINIGYFGVLEQDNRGLEDLLEAVGLTQKNIKLHLIGYGPLDDYSFRQSVKYPNKVKCYGPMSSSAGLDIMSGMDILVGFYYKKILNHLYAAPNKYYEHLMLGKAFLTTEGIPPGEKTVLYNTGWAIDEGVDSILNFFNNVNINDIKIKSNNAKQLWLDNYHNYYDEQYKYVYVKSILGLAEVNK